MNRTTNILGFAFLALAVTMAATITMRNGPRGPRQTHTETNSKNDGTARRGNVSHGNAAPSGRATAGRNSQAANPHVTVPAELLATLSEGARKDWQERVAAVESQANDRLDKLSEQLDLSLSQRGKLFSAVVRSTPGYDPAMVITGVPDRGVTDLTPAEEIHALLDEEQRESIENEEVNRQLWWQDIIDKLEADLTNTTGGDGMVVPEIPAAIEPEAPTDDREAPESHDDGNLFDMLKP